MELWMYWITAIVFTIVGYCMSIEHSRKLMVKLTIENLIEQGYVRTRGFGDDQELVKLDDD